MMTRKVRGAGSNAADRLLSLIERVERLEEERKALADDIKEIYGEAKAAGFDPKMLREMIKERRLSPEERREWDALRDVYRAALGMLDGTPLGEHARRRFQDRRSPPAKDATPGGETPDEDTPGVDAASGGEPPAPLAAPSAEDLVRAKAEGAVAAKAGKRVFDNPYAAGDARRAAWDEGWCAASASDGMDIPDAWRRSKPKKADGAGKDGRAPA